MASAVSAHFERERRGLPGWGSLAPLYFICRLYPSRASLHSKHIQHTTGTYLHNLTRGHTYTIYLRKSGSPALAPWAHIKKFTERKYVELSKSRSRSRSFAIPARRTTTGPVETHRGGRRSRAFQVALNLGANPRKFKILQHRKWEVTELDIAKHLHLFPAQMHGRELMRPKVTCGALKVNGVAIGHDEAARVEIIHAQVRAHEIKLKILEAFRPSLGAQTTELYGRFALKPSTVFNHQARGNEPSISREPLERAAESQARLFRTITRTSLEEIRDVQHDANPNGPKTRRCEEAMHLSQRHGGVGWAHPRLIAAGASSGRVVDTIYLIRRSEDVSALVPSPERWATSGKWHPDARGDGRVHPASGWPVEGLRRWATGRPSYATVSPEGRLEVHQVQARRAQRRPHLGRPGTHRRATR